MNRLSFTTWGGSVALHALIVLPLGLAAATTPAPIYQDGTGQDSFKTAQGLTVELVSLGDAAERIELAEVTPMTAAVTPPVEPVKTVEPDLAQVIKATESPADVAVVTEQPPPEPAKSEEPAVRDQAAQLAIVTEKSAGVAQDGGRATALSLYAGQINQALSKVKLGRRLPASGSVLVGISVDPGGRVTARSVIRSSGNPAIDKLAVEMVDKAAFPPPPASLGGNELYTVPFSFSTRSG